MLPFPLSETTSNHSDLDDEKLLSDVPENVSDGSSSQQSAINWAAHDSKRFYYYLMADCERAASSSQLSRD
ncbi:unnamed protein product [Ambrosiozyma monospora]|uniref:Unnamed protein product n=1 Tax=Ambrosiozyma monospora TaxID=43982 RepID=A0ACB5SR34_AMBMO|nr:unnamed protein product [Ambrosiozyma monospora]